MARKRPSIIRFAEMLKELEPKDHLKKEYRLWSYMREAIMEYFEELDPRFDTLRFQRDSEGG